MPQIYTGKKIHDVEKLARILVDHNPKKRLEIQRSLGLAP